MIPKTGKPPGQKLVKRMSLRAKWLLLAPMSLVLIGAGLCVFSEAAELKHKDAAFSRWFLMGTYSLILINGGLSMLGQAIVFKSQMFYRAEMRREIKKMQKEMIGKLRRKKDKDNLNEKSE